MGVVAEVVGMSGLGFGVHMYLFVHSRVVLSLQAVVCACRLSNVCGPDDSHYHTVEHELVLVRSGQTGGVHEAQPNITCSLSVYGLLYANIASA